MILISILFICLQSRNRIQITSGKRGPTEVSHTKWKNQYLYLAALLSHTCWKIRELRHHLNIIVSRVEKGRSQELIANTSLYCVVAWGVPYPPLKDWPELNRFIIKGSPWWVSDEKGSAPITILGNREMSGNSPWYADWQHTEAWEVMCRVDLSPRTWWWPVFKWGNKMLIGLRETEVKQSYWKNNINSTFLGGGSSLCCPR